LLQNYTTHSAQVTQALSHFLLRRSRSKRINSDASVILRTLRELTDGIPIGVKLSAQHIERDIEAALEIGVDYIILDGRGGGTGAAPLIFRDNITEAALEDRERKYDIFRRDARPGKHKAVYLRPSIRTSAQASRDARGLLRESSSRVPGIQ
jgi:hypothetical protein